MEQALGTRPLPTNLPCPSQSESGTDFGTDEVLSANALEAWRAAVPADAAPLTGPLTMTCGSSSRCAQLLGYYDKLGRRTRRAPPTNDWSSGQRLSRNRCFSVRARPPAGLFLPGAPSC